jgi:hypothetical protein
LSGDEMIDFSKDFDSIFLKKLNSPIQYSSVILRVSEINLNSKPIRMMLISEPLIFQNCSWKFSKPMTPDIINSPVSLRINELIQSHNITDSGGNLFKDNEEKKSTKYSYQDFLEKMKHKSTLHLVKSIKKFNDSILNSEFDDKTHETITSFLSSMEETITNHHLWKDASEIELDNTIEGLEKYVTSKLYNK